MRERSESERGKVLWMTKHIIAELRTLSLLLSHMTHLRPLIGSYHGIGRGINSTAGAKTEFDGPSRESGTYWIHVVSAPLTMEIGINRGMDPMEARARSDMDGTSSRPRPSIRSITIQPVYGICMQWNSRCNIVLSVQNESLMIVSVRQDIWFPVSYFCRFTMLLCRDWFTNSIHGLWQVYLISFFVWSTPFSPLPPPLISFLFFFFFPPFLEVVISVVIQYCEGRMNVLGPSQVDHIIYVNRLRPYVTFSSSWGDRAIGAYGSSHW